MTYLTDEYKDSLVNQDVPETEGEETKTEETEEEPAESATEETEAETEEEMESGEEL